MFDTILYILAVICYILAIIGVVYPIVPGGLFYGLAIFILGYIKGFMNFDVSFWIIQGIIAFFLFFVDYAVNYFGIQKSGGTKAAVWGSFIGIIIGPFIIPVIGILIGAIAGAIIGQLFSGEKSWKKIGKVGFGSGAGFIVSVLLKGIVLISNMIYLLFKII
ncbi:DUF456 family protein [Alteribacillus sp. YIM 98480]|uniref:DUF456 family protein n=1 Tax=Alteribacillus sp. YIM 98480 TaxID=2606599 RepID=UPI00131E72F2|nr:DUF456 family protein [Alteribacillus sp. YIM 98480]